MRVLPGAAPMTPLPTKVKGSACVLSRVRHFATLWTAACRAPLSMEFSRQECWSRCHLLLQGIFPTQVSNPHLLSPALAGGFFTS